MKLTDELIIDERPVDYEDTYHEGFQGWGVWRDEKGRYYLEYVQQEKAGAILPWTMLLIYRADVPEDVYKEHDWAAGDADEADMERGRSDDPKTRAWTLYYLGDSHGWENIDGYPLRLSAEELRERWGIKEEIVVPDEGTPQEQAARAAYRLFHLAAKNPELSLPDALTKGMTRVRRTEGKTAPSSWGYAKVAKMLHELDGRLSDYAEMTMVCVDMKNLSCCAAGLRERWGIQEEIVVPDEGTPQERATRAAYRLFHLAAKNPELSLPDALAKGMTRVRRTEGKTGLGGWGYEKVAKMLHELDGRLSDYAEMTMVCVDMKNLSCCAAGLSVTRESEE